VLFALQLLLYSFHEFTEANALPIDNAHWHLATEEWAEGTYANLVSIALVVVPALWLGCVSFRTTAHGRVSIFRAWGKWCASPARRWTERTDVAMQRRSGFTATKREISTAQRRGAR